MRVRAILFSVVLAVAVPAAGHAQTAHRTHFTDNFDACRAGASARPRYLAWLPGIGTYCLASAAAPKQAIAGTVAECDRFYASMLRRLGASAACRIAYDGNRIVDPAFARALTRYDDLPITLDIYDAATDTLQSTRAVVRRTSGRTVSFTRVAVDYVIDAQGVIVCSGAFVASSSSMTATFTSRCFDEPFNGTAPFARMIRVGKSYAIVPDTVTIRSGKSWIRLTY